MPISGGRYTLPINAFAQPVSGAVVPATDAATTLEDIANSIDAIVIGTGQNDGSTTNAKLADMAQGTIKGRASGAGTGVPVDLTPAQARAAISAVEAPSTSGGSYGLNGGASGDVFYQRRTLTGTKAVGADGPMEIYSPSGFMWDIRMDDADAGNDFLIGHRFRHIVTGSAAKGGRDAVGATLEMRVATDATHSQRNYAGFQAKSYSYAGDGGSGTGISSAKGAMFGSGSAVYLGDPDTATNATNLLDGAGQEVNTFTKSGTTVRYLSALSLVMCNASRGAAIDAFVRISGMSATGLYGAHIGSDFGVLFTNASGADPTYANSTLFGSKWFDLGTGAADTTPRSVANGIDLSGFSISGNLLKGQTARIADDGGSTRYGGSAAVNLGAHDVTLLSMAGTSGAGSWTLQGRGGGVSPYIISADDVVFRAGGGGTLDVNFPTTTSPGGTGFAVGAETAWVEVKVNGVSRKIPCW